jgi:hypothetical protein
MLETTSFEMITQIRMGREIGGKPVYWVAAYPVDGPLIDTGCSYTADEFASFLDGREGHQAVNTHFHGVTERTRRLFGGEHRFARVTNGQYRTENLIRFALRMGGSR